VVFLVAVVVCALVVVMSGAADVGSVLVVTEDSVVDGTEVVVGAITWPFPDWPRRTRPAPAEPPASDHTTTAASPRR
jgi:hypothetical protein